MGQSLDDIWWHVKEADNRSLKRLCKDIEKWKVETDSDRQGRVEAYILERLDNVARAFLPQGRGLDYIEYYEAALRSWCEDVLPDIEKEFRPKLSKAALRLIKRTFGSVEGRIIGSVDRAKLAGRIAHWQAEAISQARNAPSPGVSDSRQPGARAAFVMPILDSKGWSILDWANECNVDFHTANDFLRDRTKSYRSTRKKLAEGLGVPVESLPK